MAVTTKRAAPDRPRYIPIHRHYTVKYSICDLDRTVRRGAMSEIFEALSLNNLRDRVNVARDIRGMLADYYNPNQFVGCRRPAEEENWFRDVEKHAAALVDLYRKDPMTFGWVLIENAEHELDEEHDPERIFSVIASVAGRHLDDGRRGRPPDTKFGLILVGDLGRVFSSVVGREAKLSRNPTTGEPTGKFFKMVRAVCLLGRIDKSDEAIATAIRRWAKARKAAGYGANGP